MSTRIPRPDGRYDLPEALASVWVAELAWAMSELEQKGGGRGGSDYGGANVQMVRQTYEAVAKRLLHLRIGDGEDMLRVSAAQAELCLACIRECLGEDEDGNPLAELLVRRGKTTSNAGQKGG